MSYLFEKFHRFDAKSALVFQDSAYSYKELLTQIETYFEIITQELPSGKVVAILGDYSFENIALFLALYKNKNIIVPITSQLKEIQELNIQESLATHILRVTDTLEITKQEQTQTHPMIEELQDKKSSGLILFSSGSTGKPKAMIHNLDTLIDSYSAKREKSMNMLLFLMFDHIGGLNTLFNVFSMGATLIIPQNRTPKEICQLIEAYKIKVLPSSPTFLNLIFISQAYLEYDLKSLRMITYGTESMPESLLIKLKETFPRVKLLQTFGTSETGISTTSSKSSESLFMKIEDLKQEYKIVDNELWLRSKTQVLGYLNASMDAFTDDGWFKTGDLVETEDGYIKIIGRSKEVINVGGEKVLPIEVESLILTMETIQDCMAYGEQNAITGQSVVIDVVTSLDTKPRIMKAEIRKFCKGRLASYKIPTKVNIVKRTNISQRFKKIRLKG